MKFSALTALVCTGVLAFTPACTVTYAESEDMRDMTTMEIVRDMGVGINLGNTMESCGDWIAQYGDGTPKSYETAWGSPEITKEMIQGYANEGFGVIRIPVAWSNMMGDNYTISPAYMARVRQIVDWSLDTGMYVILNIHYDNGWWENFPKEKDECMKKYTRVWEQITDSFGDYGDKLMFESLNEEGGWDSVWNQWNGTEDQKKQSYSLLNEINQKFVDIVRSSGKNNGERHLLIAGYKTDVALTCDKLFEMPDDPADRLILSVHYYTPWQFCITGDIKSWGSDSDRAELEGKMSLLKSNFIDKGIPVIIGEYGFAGNTASRSQIEFSAAVNSACHEMGAACFLWDDGGIIDRADFKWRNPELMAGIREAIGQKVSLQ